jgi:Zn-dependent protease with chaperone function
MRPTFAQVGFRRATVSLIAALVAAGPALAQTEIKLPKNKYTPKQDVELGRKGAAEVRKQYPIIEDRSITRYLTELGDRLVVAAPANLKESVYEYSFTPVNLKEINAFALPGGPMFVHRGMFAAAAGEAEVGGVMAHELAHVLLRHGTANASKAQNPWLQIGQIAGILGGAVVGGAAGSAIMQGTQFGLGTVLMKYSREYEKQADLLGAQIMARAGYDPRALARMFETIEKESRASGSGAPEWLSSHPNPGNRTAYITKEAEMLQIAEPPDMRRFGAIKETFAAMPPAKSMAEVAKRGNGEGEAPRSVGTPGQTVPRPSSQYRRLDAGLFQTVVPNNWTSLSSSQSVKAVPQNGYGSLKGQTVFTHGVEFGVAPAASRDLRDATTAWLNTLNESNPGLRISGEPRSTRLSQRTAIATRLVNPSPLGGRELIDMYTTFLSDGNLFYYMTIAPEDDEATYRAPFQKVGQQLRLTETR